MNNNVINADGKYWARKYFEARKKYISIYGRKTWNRFHPQNIRDKAHTMQDAYQIIAKELEAEDED